MSEAKAKKEAKPKAVKAPKAPKAEKAPKAPKVARERQNGQTRPAKGSKTGLVWDLADSISQKMKRPALRSEVFAELEKEAKNPSFAMAGTQYSRWCAFHNVAAELKKFKTADSAAKDEAKAKEKADKKAKADAEKKAAADKKSEAVQRAATAAAAKKKAA